MSAQLLLALAVVTVVSTSGCVNGASSTGGTRSVTTQATPSGAARPEAPASGPCADVDEERDYGDYTIAGIREHGTLAGLSNGDQDIAAVATVVVATVTRIEPAVWRTADGIRPANLDPSRGWGNYPFEPVVTPVDLSVERAVRGEIDLGAARAIVEGGTVGCFVVRVDPVPQVTPGKRYLTFLGATFCADGKTPYPLFSFTEVWPIRSDGTVMTPAGPRNLADLERTIRALPAPTEPTSTPSPAA